MPRKKQVEAEKETLSAAENEMTPEGALEEFLEENNIHHSSEETAVTELEDILSENDATTAESKGEEMNPEEKVESATVSDEAVYFASVNSQSQGMTREMFTLFSGAQYSGTVLTGRLTGVERTPLGIVAGVSYNKNDGTLNNLNGVSVKINADNMGLRMDLIRRGISERNERNGLHPSEAMFEAQVRNYQFRFLRRMLGAKIDFITESIIEEAYHEAEYEYIKHPAETKQVKIVDREAYSYEEPVYEEKWSMICWGCGADVGNDNMTIAQRDEHMVQHILNGEPDGYHSGYTTVQVGTRTVNVPEESHYETKIVKEAWTEKKLIREAGWY